MRKLFTLKILLLIAFLTFGIFKVESQINITSNGVAFTENFDGMGSSATATVPGGFKIGTDWTTGTTATTLAYGTTGTGAVTGTPGGGVINWGNGVTATATDRALGFLNTGSFTSPKSIVLKITNNTGSSITSLNISFDYEKYRSGSRQFDWTFFHGSTSTPTTSATAGDQSYPADANNTVINNPPSTITKTINLTGLSIANGTDYYFRWTFTGLGGSTNGQGIGIDNFSITAPLSISSDATLSNLQLSSGTLSPAFNSSTLTYNASVPNSVNSITVTPTANESHATIKVNGSTVASGTASSPIALAIGNNTLTVDVTAQDGTTTKSYSIVVNTATAGTPTITQTSALADFGNVCVNTTAGPNSFSLDGNNLNGTNISIGALAGFTYSLSSAGTYTSTVNFSYSSNSFSGKIIYVKFTPTVVQSYNGNIPVSGGGVAGFNVTAVGSGINTTASVTTGGNSAVTATTATVAGTIDVAGCSPITAYGFEYSTSTGFLNGTGTQVFSSNLSSGAFSYTLTGLAPNTRYYYKAFATSSSGTTYGTQQAFTNPALPVVMSAQPGLSYTEDFHDIANWTNFFIGGVGANHFGGLSTFGSGGIPNGSTITAATNSFQSGSPASPSASGGVHRGTDQPISTESIVLLSTGSTDNSSSAAIDFYLDFTGVNAGTLSFDWASINNQTGDRKGSLKVYGTVDGITFTEIPSAAVLNFANNTLTNGSVTNIALPAFLNNNANARLRFYYYNGSGGTTGSRPKLSIDNLTVTAVPSIACTTPTAQPTSMSFGTISDVSIQGSFAAAIPSSDQYITIVSTNNALTSGLIDGTIYNVGDAFGDGTVVSKGSALNFSATSLSPSTTYYFFTFAVNGICTGGPKYLSTNPLTKSATTTAGLPPCTAPTSQPTQLTFNTVTSNSIQGSFNTTAADEYLILKSTSSTPSANPVNGQVYNFGDIIGNATVIQRNNISTFTASGLSPDTKYYFYIFSLNSKACINGPTYNGTSPLSGNQATNPLPPCVVPSSQPTSLSLTAANSAISGTFTGSNNADNYLIVRSTSSSLSSVPVNNTDYIVGASFGGGVIIAQ
jgi:hypothetical protein